tara:strand:+ start:358 stop:1179 length:822 start_codon:yes stop_codon:yes gene_type:complete
MKLAVSNIAWDPPETDAVIAMLQEAGVHGIEIAPTKIWPDWQGMSPSAAATVKERLGELGFAVPALQSILLGKPDLQVFGDEASVEALVGHIAQVADVAAALGARTLVFDAPTNRDPGDMPAEEAMEHATSTFRLIAAVCADRGVVLGIEANPPAYGCTFLTGWSEAADMVRRVDHSGVSLHLDIACTEMAGDQAADAFHSVSDIVSHVHISEPRLGDFSAPQMHHEAFGKALDTDGYDGWASVEMRRTDDPVAAIRTAVDYVKAHYPFTDAE